jgi:hypothetical protein
MTQLQTPHPRTPEQRAQDAKDRRRLVREGVAVAHPVTQPFVSALCQCRQTLVRDGRSWVHLISGTVECGS